MAKQKNETAADMYSGLFSAFWAGRIDLRNHQMLIFVALSPGVSQMGRQQMDLISELCSQLMICLLAELCSGFKEKGMMM